MSYTLIANMAFSFLSYHLEKEKQEKEFEQARKQMLLQMDEHIQQEVSKHSKKLNGVVSDIYNKERFAYAYLYFRMYVFRFIFLLFVFLIGVSFLKIKNEKKTI